MNSKQLLFALYIALSSGVASAKSPAFSPDQRLFEQALHCTQQKIRLTLSTFISQAKPVMKAIQTYVEEYQGICESDSVPSKNKLQPLIKSLLEFRDQLVIYNKNPNIDPNTEDLTQYLVSNSDLSLANLYQTRGIYWEYNYSGNETLRLKLSKIFEDNKESAYATYRSSDFIFAHLKYHHEFDDMDLNLLLRISNVIPTEKGCQSLAGKFLDLARNQMLPHWSQLLEISHSDVIVGKFDQAPIRCQ